MNAVWRYRSERIGLPKELHSFPFRKIQAIDQLLIGTNIFLGLIAKREDFYEEASMLFSRAEKEKVNLHISLFNLGKCILSRSTTHQQCIKVLRKLKVLIEVLPIDGKIIGLALNPDFKGAIQ